MEAQPQLLLLQKTMLVAEGTGRSLAPEANIWFMARPLIKKWMLKNFNPEVYVRETVDGLARAAVRLPKVINDMEVGAALLSKGHIRLHPETIEALKQSKGSRIKKVVLCLTLASLLGTLAFIAIT